MNSKGLLKHRKKRSKIVFKKNNRKLQNYQRFFSDVSPHRRSKNLFQPNQKKMTLVHVIWYFACQVLVNVFREDSSKPNKSRLCINTQIVSVIKYNLSSKQILAMLSCKVCQGKNLQIGVKLWQRKAYSQELHYR